MWRKVYPAAEIPNGYRMKEMFYDLQINDIGEVVVVGGDFSQDEERGFLMKLSPEGEDIWRKDYASPALYGLDIIPDEGYILCGDDLCLLRADINGDELWQHTMRGGINRSVWAVGNCYIACGSTTVNQGDISRTYMHCLRASDQGYAPRKPTLLTMDEVPPIFWNPPPFRKGLE